MLPTLAVCERASVAGGGVGRLLFVLRVSMHGRSERVHVIAVDTLTVDSLGYEITSQYFDSRCVFFRRLRVWVRAGARECTNCTFLPLCKCGERLSLLARYAASVSARDRLLMNIQ